MKRVCLIVTLVLFLFLTSCGEDTTGLAKEEFSKYYNGKNEVVLNIEDNFYFENYVVKRDILEPKNLSSSIVFYNKSIYYLSLESSNLGFKNDSINVYTCDIYGNNVKKLHSKEINIYGDVEIEIYNYDYYIKYRKNGLDYIDKYTIPTGIYENVDSGKDCALSDYMPKEEQNRYSVEVIENITPQKHGKFIITDLETGTVKIIDDDYLKQTVYIESMEKFNYSPKRVDFSNGHILLTYGIGAGDGWNYAHLVFDYDFDSNTIEYKLLAFPFDSIPIEIIYIG